MCTAGLKWQEDAIYTPIVDLVRAQCRASRQAIARLFIAALGVMRDHTRTLWVAEPGSRLYPAPRNKWAGEHIMAVRHCDTPEIANLQHKREAAKKR